MLKACAREQEEPPPFPLPQIGGEKEGPAHGGMRGDTRTGGVGRVLKSSKKGHDRGPAPLRRSSEGGERSELTVNANKLHHRHIHNRSSKRDVSLNGRGNEECRCPVERHDTAKPPKR